MVFKEALIIVDMQEYFDTAKDKETINNVKKLIKEFKEEKLPIIILEYFDSNEDIGYTLPCLTKLLDDYYLTRYVTKSNDDGGDEVIKCLNNNNWKIKNFVVCGVNLGACVKETVWTLTYIYYKHIKVVKNACNGMDNRKDAFNRNKDFYLNTPNLAVV